MNSYHKIQTIFKRDPDNDYKTLLIGEYSLPEFEYLKDNEWVFTEKVDGMNIRVMFDGKTIRFGGKTDKAKMPTQLLEHLFQTFYPLLDHFKETFNGSDISVCLYGEGFGAGIQKGGNYSDTQKFVLFDVNINEWWLQGSDVEEIGNKLGIDLVPVVGVGTLNDAIKKTEEGFNSQWGNFLAEGIVARPKVELRSRNGSRVITKIKHKDFL